MLVGRTIGNYVVRAKVAEGAMGAVYRADHPHIGRPVAVKVLLPHHSQNPEIVKRFSVEAKAAYEIKSDHIVEILDFGNLEDGASYLVMEWLEGKSLGKVLQADPKLSVGRALHIAEGVAEALKAAHARGVVHRDLKPDNVFLTHRGLDSDFVKVLDFGIAKLTLPGEGFNTESGALLGTPAYMSPEQCRSQPVDARSDLYALGVMLYQMLSGRLPFSAASLGDLLIQHMLETPPSLAQIDPSLPPMVVSAVERAMMKSPSERWQSAEHFLRAVRGQRMETPIDILGPTAPRPISNPDAPPVSPALKATMAQASAKAVVEPPSAKSEKDSSAQNPLAKDTLDRAAAESLARPTRHGSRIAIGALLGMAISLVVLVVLVSLRRQKENPSSSHPAATGVPANRPSEAPASPILQASQPSGSGSASSASEQATVAILFSATPAGAVIKLDNVAMTNPFSGRFPKGRHLLTVSAAGFISLADWISFERDNTFKIELQRAKKSSERKHPVTTPGKGPKIDTEMPH